MPEFVVRSIHPQENRAAAHLVAQAFAPDSQQLYQSIYDYWLNDLALRPHESVNHYRGAFIENRLVSLARTVEYRLHYGQAVLKVTGIGAVCTHPDYRRQGLASAVMQDVITYAAEQGAHLALLQTETQGFYDRFGFMPVWADYMLQAPVRDALLLHAPLQFRRTTPADLPQVARLYNKHWGSRVTFSRSPALWKWEEAHGRGQSFVAAAFDKVEGYIWHEDELTKRVEVVADTPEAAQTLLVASARRWQQASDTLYWSLPPDDVIIPFVQHILPVTLSAAYLPNGGWMARIIDSSMLIKTLLPEIIQQARAMSGSFNQRDLIFNLNSDSVELGLQSVPESHCQLALRDFIQILFGSLRPATLALRQPLTRESTGLLELLFPARIASIAARDWF